jgi:hypothetical protein
MHAKHIINLSTYYKRFYVIRFIWYLSNIYDAIFTLVFLLYYKKWM